MSILTSKSTTTATLSSLLLLGLAPASSAQGSECHKLLPSDGLAGDLFGSAVATDGTLVAVGAPSADDAGSSSGSAYVSGAHSGVQILELLPSDGGPGDRFGASIAVDGARVVVGAPLADGVGADSGAAYVFDAITGLQVFELEPADAAAGDQFGYSVAMDGDLVVVGTLGAAYVFDAATGQELDKLLPVTGSSAGFGEAVDIDDGLVVVGARTADGASGFSGAAYVFDAASGSELHRLIAVDGTAWAFFGASVGIEGSVIAVGAPMDGPKGKHSGAAYEFDAITGQQTKKLFPGDGHVFAEFGSSVGTNGQHLVIGSQQNNPNGLFSSGSVYVYDVQSGSLVAKLVASDAAALDEMGGAVAVAGDVIVSGAARDDDLGDASGAAYVFNAGGCGGLGGSYCDSNSNSSGSPASLTASGSPQISRNDVTFDVVSLPANRFGYFLMSVTQDFVPLFGGSQGNLCLGGQIIRFDKFVLNSGASGAVTFSPDLTNLPQGTVFSPGETWNFQYWTRDVNPTQTSNTSNGLEIQFH